MKNLSIIILAFNKFNFTKSCLQDLSKLSNDHQIIVVDNASSDETQQQLQNSTEITYYRSETNLGFAGGCNLGYSIAEANNVLFLNNDIRVKSEHDTWTQRLLPYCQDYLVGPTMGQLDSNFNFVREANQELVGLSYMSGWCLASSKHNFNKLNLGKDRPQIFSEEFGKAYFEDTDLSFRARQLGLKFKVVEIPVVHFGRISSQQLNTAKLYQEAKKVFDKKWRKTLK